MKSLSLTQLQFYSEVVFSLFISVIMTLHWWGVYMPTPDGIVKILLVIGTVMVPLGYLYRIYTLEKNLRLYKARVKPLPDILPK
ncbi:hypothetical protein [Salinimonas chungwhensis]|uniref:hypothetical protein n=1 Tax=Salinimonas chungwhensis TaxID=265425 RepID=UPI000374D8E7|nr:hypothetical protein [Salinimonas chungwhensis]